jgi:class 3 adenylate cyclase/cold shock CspA family protein
MIMGMKPETTVDQRQEQHMSEHKQLREAFADPKSRMDATVVVIDVINSTYMKQSQPQAAWLSSLGWFYDVVRDIAEQRIPDVTIKYLGDGIMLTCSTDYTTQAVGAAVEVQEAISQASRSNAGAPGLIEFACSVGISTGMVVAFTTGSGTPDFVGSVVDKAFRLCSAANANAIFLDTATLGAANAMRIRSIVGEALDRSVDEYVGEVQKTPLKGFDKPVAYHELQWDKQLYGVKSSTVTASTDRMKAPAPVRSDDTAPTASVRPLRPDATNGQRCGGTVKCWKSEQGFGFIQVPGAETDYHLSRKHLVYEDEGQLAVGAKVAFVALPSPGRSPEAVAVLLDGQPADGPLVARPEGKPYGWIRIDDDHGHRQLVYVPARELASHRVGDILGFTVRVNDRGAYAEAVERLQGADAA